MRKISVALFFSVFLNAVTAQYTTLISHDFQADPITDILVGTPDPLNTSVWYSFDEDGEADASGSNRPGEWFLTFAFALPDSLLPNGSENVVLSSNSWIGGSMQASNWFISPVINVTNASYRLRFKSAPRQTPRYLDGFRVCVSTTSNDDIPNFGNNVLFVASQMTGNPAPPNPNNFASYTYSPTIAMNGWVHGWDGTSIQSSQLYYNGDSTRHIGILTEHTLNLGSFSGQQIYLAFHHNSYDDNLISIDDIVVEYIMGTNDINLELFTNVYPNPTTDFIELTYNLQEQVNTVLIEITDVYGRLVYAENHTQNQTGKNIKRFDVSSWAAGTYNITVKTEKGFNNISFIKQ